MSDKFPDDIPLVCPYCEASFSYPSSKTFRGKAFRAIKRHEDAVFWFCPRCHKVLGASQRYRG